VVHRRQFRKWIDCWSESIDVDLILLPVWVGPWLFVCYAIAWIQNTSLVSSSNLVVNVSYLFEAYRISRRIEQRKHRWITRGSTFHKRPSIVPNLPSHPVDFHMLTIYISDIVFENGHSFLSAATRMECMHAGFSLNELLL
jgi:hypothetical protein